MRIPMLVALELATAIAEAPEAAKSLSNFA